MEQKQNKDNLIQKLIYAGLFLVAAVAFVRQCGYMLNTFACSTAVNAFNEYRDFPSLRTSYAIMNGVNPYTAEGMTTYNVPMLNLYSGLNPLLAALLSKATKISLMFSYRLLNVIYLCASTFALTKILCTFEKKYVAVKAMFSFIIVTTCGTILYMSGYCLRPDAIAVCVYMFLLLLTKEKKNVFLMSILSVLLFFTKQTMVVMVLPVFIWLLIFDRKKAWGYMVLCLAEGAICVVLLEVFAPYYITSVVVAQFYGSSKANFHHFTENLADFADAYKSLLIADAVMLALGAAAFIKSRGRLKTLSSQQKYIILMGLNILVALPALCFVGRNGVDGFKYFKEMLVPSLAILGIYSLEQIKTEKGFVKAAVPLLGVAGLAVSSLLICRAFTLPVYTKENLQGYKDFNLRLAEYDEDKIYLGNAVCYWALENDNLMQNGWTSNGHIENFFNDSHFFTGFEDEKYQYMKTLAFDYKDFVNNKVENGDFEVLCMDTNDMIIDKEILQKNYEPSGSYNIAMDMGCWEITLWEKK